MEGVWGEEVWRGSALEGGVGGGAQEPTRAKVEGGEAAGVHVLERVVWAAKSLYPVATTNVNKDAREFTYWSESYGQLGPCTQ